MEFNETQYLILKRVLEAKGEKYVLTKLIEESAELTQHLCKRLNHSKDVTEADICEEIAHVGVFLKISEILFPSNLIKDHQEERIQRLFKQLNDGKN